MSAKSDAALSSSERSDRVLSIARVFDAPPSLVYQAWTRREHVINWLAPTGFTVTHSEGDLRIGGKWRSCMRSPEGVDHWVGGEYREIIPDERLVFTHQWNGPDGKPGHETLVTVTFSKQGDKTKMNFHQGLFKSVESRNGHEGGWGQSFDRLVEYVKQIKPEEVNAKTGGGTSSGTADREISTIRVFDAPRELVYKLWTDPHHIAHWWGPNGFSTTTQKMEVRAGGVWRFCMHGPDGRDYENKITYLEVVPLERLVYDHGGLAEHEAVNFRVTVEFEDVGDKTKLHMRSLFPSAAARDFAVREYGAVQGMQQTLERLAERLEQLT